MHHDNGSKTDLYAASLNHAASDLLITLESLLKGCAAKINVELKSKNHTLSMNDFQVLTQCQYEIVDYYRNSLIPLIEMMRKHKVKSDQALRSISIINTIRKKGILEVVKGYTFQNPTSVDIVNDLFNKCISHF